jgi:prepilin-type N-terminal cleavage/methylation domain-containing protein/prepilin-type processing-associated H-X9-DG protein
MAMRRKKGFTLVELLVVISIIALLLSVLIPSLSKTRELAKELVCKSNTRQCGVMFSAYTQSNDGKFHSRKYLDQGLEDEVTKNHHVWPKLLERYSNNPKLLCCPTANNPEKNTGTFGTWAYLNNPPAQNDWVPNTYGSLGINAWVVDMIPLPGDTPNKMYWRRTDVKGASEVPVILDSMNWNGKVTYRDEPPMFEGDRTNGHSNRMQWFCVPRHSGGRLNVLFMDWSTRLVGVRSLWQLEWYRNYQKDRALDPYNLDDWPEWMRKLKL